MALAGDKITFYDPAGTAFAGAIVGVAPLTTANVRYNGPTGDAFAFGARKCDDANDGATLGSCWMPA